MFMQLRFGSFKVQVCTSWQPQCLCVAITVWGLCIGLKARTARFRLWLCSLTAWLCSLRPCCVIYHFLQELSIGFTDFCGKFGQILRATSQNFTDHCSKIVFVSKLSFVLLRNFSYWRLALWSVMLATYEENQLFSFQKCNLSNHFVH